MNEWFDAKHGFVALTFTAVAGLFIITLWGSISTTRPFAPTISTIIDDDSNIRIVYGVVVGLITVARSGLVFQSTFYDISSGTPECCATVPKRKKGYSLLGEKPPKTKRPSSWCLLPDIKSKDWAYVAAVFGSAQLICFALIGMFSVTREPTDHYVIAGFTVAFTIPCEAILFLRRVAASPVWTWDLGLNLFVLVSIVVIMGTFIGLILNDMWTECKSYDAVLEWTGYYLIATINVFRTNDVNNARNCHKCLTKDEKDDIRA